MGAPQEVRSRAAYGVLLLGAVALGVLLLGPWGLELNRVTVWFYVFFRNDVPIAPDWARPGHYGALLNVVLFVPVGMALGFATRWSWWQVALFATAGSALVELVQATVVDRVGSLVDVVTNGVGALIGAVAITVVSRLQSRR